MQYPPLICEHFGQILLKIHRHDLCWNFAKKKLCDENES